MDGLKAGRDWFDNAPDRRAKKVERRNRRAANRVTGRAGRKQRKAQRQQWRDEDRTARQARRDARREERLQRIVDRAHDEARREHERRGQQSATGPTSQTDPGNGGRPETVQGTITVDEPPARPTPAPKPQPLPDPPPQPPQPFPLDSGGRQRGRRAEAMPCTHPDTRHADDGVITCVACSAAWMCTHPDHNHLATPAVPEHLRCQWEHGGDRCPAAATLTATYQGVTRRFCDPHALNVADTARDQGESVQWAPFNPDQTAIEGDTDMSAPAIPTGEIQGKADTERALQGYRGVVTTYQDDLAAVHTEAQDTAAAANRLAEQLSAAELGQNTMAAVASVQENAAALARLTAQLGPAGEAVLADLSEFDASVAAHDAVEAAAITNNDGGTTEWHADGGYVNNTNGSRGDARR